MNLMAVNIRLQKTGDLLLAIEELASLMCAEPTAARAMAIEKLCAHLVTLLRVEDDQWWLQREFANVFDVEAFNPNATMLIGGTKC